MASVTANGKITPASVGEPAAAKPPPTSVPGGPIDGAAAKTADSVAEAAAAHQILAAPNMAGGGVEVKPPGGAMPTNGGTSFGDTYVAAVGSLHQLASDGSADTLVTAPPETVDPAHVGGGARIGRHWKTPQSRYHASELAKGVKMEMEHTDSHTIALEIAKDHLSELPDYYSRLERMEKRAFAERKKKGHKTRKHGRGNKRTHRRRNR